MNLFQFIRPNDGKVMNIEVEILDMSCIGQSKFCCRLLLCVASVLRGSHISLPQYGIHCLISLISFRNHKCATYDIVISIDNTLYHHEYCSVVIHQMKV